MSVIESLKEIKRFYLKQKKDKWNYGSKYILEGTIKEKPQMLFVLAGYKQKLWDDVFGRFKAFETADMEICIASSGKYSPELSAICKKNGWVYISTSLNNVCVITNIIIKLFDKAEYIFKLDEDIYIPKGYFENMKKAYDQIEKENPDYSISYVCPVLPLGFYGMHDFLIKKNCLSEYEEKFGKHLRGGTPLNPSFRKKCGVDEFIWEKIGNFDECAAEYAKEPFSYEIAPLRTGIATILFKRKFWDEFGGLQRPKGIGIGDNGDEGQITSYCALNFRASFCIKNILVGHFSFGGAEKNVLELRERHPEIFKLNLQAYE